MILIKTYGMKIHMSMFARVMVNSKYPYEYNAIFLEDTVMNVETIILTLIITHKS